MRKNVLSMSIAAMIGGLGLVGSANAVVFQAPVGFIPGGGTVAVGPADTFAQSNTGVGNVLIVPYFSTQSGNSTLLNIVNTDASNGKAVKVRFRGASNSDDIFDFQLYLSPSDAWTANISQGADGRSVLTTSDKTCTLPSTVMAAAGNPFDVTRMPASFTAAEKAAETREGYIEILTMADVPKALQPGQFAATPTANNPLWDAIKHVAGVAPCTATTMGALANEPTLLVSLAAVPVSGPNVVLPIAETPAGGQGGAASTLGLINPTGTLFANYTIINVPKTLAFAGEATALLASNSAFLTSNNLQKPAGANLVFYPQTSTAARAGATTYSSAETSDPSLLRSTPLAVAAIGAVNPAVVTGAASTQNPTTFAGAAAVTARQFDFPDLSTPLIGNTTGAAAANTLVAGVITAPAAGNHNAITFAELLSNALTATSVVNEQLGNAAISAGTDWTFSMPTRRYHVAMNYGWALATNAAFSGALDGRIFTTRTAAANTLFDGTNTSVNTAAGKTHQICTTADAITSWNREEVTSAGGFVISPAVSTTVRFCGEASVLSFNAGGADQPSVLGSTLARQDVTTAFLDGWTAVGVSGLGAAGAKRGLPVVGRSYIKAQNGTVFFGIGANHRYTRP